MQLGARVETFDSSHSAAASLSGEHNATWARETIHKNRAGSTIARFTAMFDAEIALAA
jgi:hypothetical protein